MTGCALGACCLVPCSSCSNSGSTSCCKLCPALWGKAQQSVHCRTWTLGCWMSRRLVFFHFSLTAWSFIEKRFLRQHWSISSLTTASYFAHVLHLHALHFPLLSLPCLGWLLLFLSLVSMCSVHEENPNSPSVPQKTTLSNTKFSAWLNIKVVSKDANKHSLLLPVDCIIISLPSHFF